MTQILIYGATGYTGQLIAEHAVARGLSPILAGRDAAKLRPLAARLGLVWRAFPLDETALREHLAGVAVVLHVAGPFSATARPMIEACLATSTHYLDLSGEIAVLEAASARDAEAKGAGIMLLPGVGYDVVPSDCLAAHVASRLFLPTRLRLSISGFAGVSRGTAKTMVEALAFGTLARRDGRIVEVAATRAETDFGAGPRRTVSLAWGDVATAFHSTGIRDIDVFFEAPLALDLGTALLPRFRRLLGHPRTQSLLKAPIALLPSGPTADRRATGRSIFVAEAFDARGGRASARLVTPEPYHLTKLTAVEIARRVAAGEFKPGYQTPATAFGADFIMGFERVSRVDLA